ncbi:hypothetical protein [Roseovarius nanhaiticus]|jgi:hypothetical protein|uniref:hypothetical protein n=1 Tax=Roseovarius nanhaiticus TaxID=573024 RepID=UPI00248FADB8|nr:hypothetical protein [Roseovarius nanhaiticus]
MIFTAAETAPAKFPVKEAPTLRMTLLLTEDSLIGPVEMLDHQVLSSSIWMLALKNAGHREDWPISISTKKFRKIHSSGVKSMRGNVESRLKISEVRRGTGCGRMRRSKVRPI